MRILGFDPAGGFAVDHFGSAGFRVMPILRGGAGLHLAVIHLAPGGLIGLHPAASQQLLLVVQGAGTVQGKEREPQQIAAGQAALWQAGEEHETRTEHGLVALVVEADDIEGFLHTP